MNLRLLESMQASEAVSESTPTSALLYIVVTVSLIAVAAFLLYDRRQNFAYMIAFREFMMQLLRRGRAEISKLKKKVSQEDKQNRQEQPSTSKSLGVLDTEKTYQEADISSIQQTSNSTPSLSDDLHNMSVEDETPQIDLKEMFEKDKRGKDKSKAKSKSKLRSRIQVKKSEIEAQEQEEQENYCEISQELEKSVEGGQGRN